MVKEIEANLCFVIFGKHSNIQNGRHCWGGEFFLVKEIVANLCFSIFWQKFENTKWPPFLWRENFLKIAKSTFLRYPVG